MCYDAGNGVYTRYPASTVSIVPATIKPVQTWVATAGGDSTLMIEVYTGTTGGFSGQEVLYWVNYGSTSCPLSGPSPIPQSRVQPGNLRANFTTSLAGAKPTGSQPYSLCYFDGLDYKFFPTSTLSIRAITFALQGFKNITGIAREFTFVFDKTAVNNTLVGSERFFWSLAPVCDQAYTGSFLSSLTQRRKGEATSKVMTLTMMPGFYTMCLDDSSGVFLPQPGVGLQVEPIYLQQPQSFETYAGKSMDFTILPEFNSVGRFSGFERFFWSASTSSCSTGRAPALSGLLTATTQSVYMSLDSVQFRDYYLCYGFSNDWNTANFLHYYTIKLTVKPIDPMDDFFSVTTGLRRSFVFTPPFSAQFLLREQFFWAVDQGSSTDCSNPTPAPPRVALPLLGNGTLVARRGDSTPVDWERVQPGRYRLCWFNGNYGDILKSYLIMNVTVRVGGIEFYPFSMQKYTGENSVIKLYPSNFGRFSGYEHVFFSRNSTCIPFEQNYTSDGTDALYSPVLLDKVGGGYIVLSLLRVQAQTYYPCYYDGTRVDTAGNFSYSYTPSTSLVVLTVQPATQTISVTTGNLH